MQFLLTMSASFKDVNELKEWLKEQQVDGRYVDTYAQQLFDSEYFTEDSFKGGFEDGELEELGLSKAVVKHLKAKFPARKQTDSEDPQTRFRRLAESAAIMVTDVVMKSVVRHFASEMTVVNTASQAAELYKRASRIPRSVTQIALREQNISVGEIFGGSDTAKSIILDAFEDGKPCLLKITDTESIDHEMTVWEAIRGIDENPQNLVPLRKLGFVSATTVQVGNMSGGYNEIQGDFRAGILMQKFQSTLARCKIPLTEAVLLRYGEQLKTAITTMHERGYCHMDIKPANVFLWEEDCYLGDYGGATKTGEPVREHTMAYYPSDAGGQAKKKTDFMLLTVVLLEMFGAVSSPPSPMTTEAIKSKVASVENENVKAFLEQLGSFDD